VRAAGLDLSLTSIGWARSKKTVPALGPAWESGVIHPKGRGAPRLWDALHQVMKVVTNCDVVVIEGYAYMAKQGGHQIGELGGVIRLGLHQRAIPYVEIAPNKLKKFATGKGSGKKEAPFGEAIRRLDYQGSSHDESDALWLLQMALHHYGWDGRVDLPQLHMTALQGISWPVVEHLEF